MAYPAEVVIVRGEPSVFPTVSLLFQILYRFSSRCFFVLPSSLSGFRFNSFESAAPLLFFIVPSSRGEKHTQKMYMTRYIHSYFLT